MSRLFTQEWTPPFPGSHQDAVLNKTLRVLEALRREFDYRKQTLKTDVQTSPLWRLFCTYRPPFSAQVLWWAGSLPPGWGGLQLPAFSSGVQGEEKRSLSQLEVTWGCGWERAPLLQLNRETRSGQQTLGVCVCGRGCWIGSLLILESVVRKYLKAKESTTSLLPYLGGNGQSTRARSCRETPISVNLSQP